MSELKPGDQVERYVVERLLGRGGAAEVYAVEHRLLGTRHALKVLHRTDAHHREQLLEEGRAQATLDPTYVLPVTDVVGLGEGLALLMPYVAGCSLEALLQRRRLTEAEVSRVVRPVALGVASAHARGLVHRDLKPSNILVDQQRQRVLRDASPIDSLRVRVADFGIVRRSGRAWVPGEKVQGSPAYMSPEVLGGAPADERADLWSLGVMLFEMLVGHRPFRALGLDALLDAVRHAPIGLDAVPARWQPVVDGLLTRDVAARIGSVDTLLERMPDPPGGEEAVGDAEATLLGEIARTLASARPEQVTSSFVGREAELESLHRLVDHGEQVVAVLGPGGVGKSALIERYAAQTVRRWPGGTVVCSLEEADGVGAICRAVLDVLGAPLVGHSPQHVATVLAARPRTLFVMDGVEQVAPDVANLVDAWAKACPDVVFLIGSRVRLRCRARTLKVGPLSRADARALLETRVVDARGGESLDATERAELDRIVGLLENMPLALELAAARATRSLGDLASELESNLALESVGGTSDTARHATLLACLEWSVDLLRPIEASTLLQLSVFVGGCTDAAALAVVGAEPDEVRGALAALVDQSLVTRGAGRLRLLESSRQLILGKLEPRDRQAVSERHARWFSRFGAWEWLVEPDRWDDGLDARADRENIRVALLFALDAGDSLDPGVLAGLARAYARVALRHGPMSEAARACRRAFDQLDPDTHALERAAVGLYLSELLRLMGMPDDIARIRSLVEAVRSSPRAAPALLAFALGQLGHALSTDSQAAGEAYLESLDLWRQVGRPGGEAAARLAYGRHLAAHGDVEQGVSEMERAEALAREHACPSVLARALYYRSYQVIRAAGNADDLAALAFEGLAVARSMGSLYREAAMLVLLGDIAIHDDVETAAAWFRKALDLIHKLESMQFTAVAYESLAILEDRRGNAAAAGALFDAAVDTQAGQASVVWQHANRARYHLRHGRFDEAIADLQAISTDRQWGQHFWSDQATLARALAKNHPDRAERIVESVGPHLSVERAPVWFVEIQLALGRIAVAREDVEALTQAVGQVLKVDTVDSIQLPERALLQGELALRTGGSDDVSKARQALESTLADPASSEFERAELAALLDRLSAPRT